MSGDEMKKLSKQQTVRLEAGDQLMTLQERINIEYKTTEKAVSHPRRAVGVCMLNRSEGDEDREGKKMFGDGR